MYRYKLLAKEADFWFGITAIGYLLFMLVATFSMVGRVSEGGVFEFMDIVNVWLLQISFYVAARFIVRFVKLVTK
jgi:hypothetical protein